MGPAVERVTLTMTMVKEKTMTTTTMTITTRKTMKGMTIMATLVITRNAKPTTTKMGCF